MFRFCLSVLLTLMNCVNVKWSANMQSFLTGVSVIALTVISVTGLVYLGRGEYSHTKYIIAIAIMTDYLLHNTPETDYLLHNTPEADYLLHDYIWD